MGRDKRKQHWQVLKIDRSEASELSMLEDPTIYTEAEIILLLARVSEGNKSTGGLTFVTKAYGIVGKGFIFLAIFARKNDNFLLFRHYCTTLKS